MLILLECFLFSDVVAPALLSFVSDVTSVVPCAGGADLFVAEKGNVCGCSCCDTVPDCDTEFRC